MLINPPFIFVVSLELLPTELLYGGCGLRLGRDALGALLPRPGADVVVEPDVLTGRVQAEHLLELVQVALQLYNLLFAVSKFGL